MGNDLPNVHSKEVIVAIYQFIAKTKHVALGHHKVTPYPDAEHQHVTADTPLIYTLRTKSAYKQKVGPSITIIPLMSPV